MPGFQEILDRAYAAVRPGLRPWPISALAEEWVLRNFIEGLGAITPPGLRAADRFEPETPAVSWLIRTKAATYPAEMVR